MAHETSEINLDQLGIEFAQMRIERPEFVNSMEQSLSKFGQLSAIIVRKGKADFQIIDGFKRYYAASALGWSGLQANILTVTRRAATAMILTYNKNNHSLNDYEEALVLFSLKKDHNMQQDEIAELVGHSPSWVSRRLALVERLDPAVKDELKLGVISSTQAREIVKLPRGNQQEVTKTIIDNDLNTRQSVVIIDEFLKTHERDQRKHILDHPLEVIERDKNKIDRDYDCRLSADGNRLLKTIRMTTRQMKWLSAQLDGRSGRALTLLDWNILEPEFKHTASLAKQLAEDIFQINRKEKNNER